MAHKDTRGLERPKYVVNELLAYACYYINTSPVEKIHTVIAKFFVLNEIETAKNTLYETMGDALGKKHVRKDSLTRPASDANVTDILTALKNHWSIEAGPQFVALDMARIPKWGPEEISLYTLTDRMNLMEYEMNKMKQELHALSVNTADAMTNHNKVNTHDDIGPEISTNILQNDTNINDKKTYSAVFKAAPSHPRTDGLQPFSNKPRNTHEKHTNGIMSTKKHGRTRPKPIIGKCKKENIRGVCKKTDIFIYRVLNDTEDAAIEKLFKDAKIPVFSFERVSHAEAKMKSFKVNIPLSNFDDVCNPDFLPEDVMCRRFFKPKAREPAAQGGYSESGNNNVFTDS